MSEKAKGIGLFGLIGMVVSSCIGSGVFAITGQLAGVASPGAVLVAWAVVGIGFALLQQHFGFIKMPGGFATPAYPVILKWSDILLTCI